MHIVADIGGTKMRIAGTSDLQSFTAEPVYVDTPAKYRDGVNAMVDAVRSVAGSQPVEKIIIGIRGVIAVDRESTTDTHTLQEWSEQPLAQDLRDTLGATSVALFNDVTLNALGEATFGAGMGARIVLYYTVSTGVNGTRIVDGRVEPAAHGFESGHQYLSMGSQAQVFGDLVSGAAIYKRFGKHPKELGKENPVWEELAEVFAYGLHNSILHWSPHRVVLGGSMFNEIGISIERVGFHLGQIMRTFPEVPEIVHSSLGDFGGLWGGLVLLRQGSEG